ncbi:SOS response-associated peptidase [Labilibacter sediminis]|nr:SOS response-associated peptidase [Labilibacter sediminis]
MCYDVKYLTQKKLKYARRRGETEAEIGRIESELNDITRDFEAQYCVSGFAHPRFLVFTADEPVKPNLFSWGLIPHWVKDEKQAIQIQNRTINARVETIFDKPSFRKPAAERRCIILIDGFFEHFYYKGKAYPIHVFETNQEPISVAGLWDIYKRSDGALHYSVTLVTSKSKGIMKKIHNNPKMSESRMPLMLNPECEKMWLSRDISKDLLLNKVTDPNDYLLKAYPVAPIRGKSALGNIPEACDEHDYATFNAQSFKDYVQLS